jgi:hypothetical protein
MKPGTSIMVYKIKSWVREKMAHANRRLVIAMACYFVLIGVALYALLPVRSKDDSFVLIIVLCVFTYLIIKTLHHAEDE